MFDLRRNYWISTKKIGIGFGTLVVARNKNVVSNDAMQPREDVCVTLRPIHNKQGSWRIMKLITGKVVNRSQYVTVPWTDIAKARMRELKEKKDKDKPTMLDDDEDFEEPELPDVDGYFPGELHHVKFYFSFVENASSTTRSAENSNVQTDVQRFLVHP